MRALGSGCWNPFSIWSLCWLIVHGTEMLTPDHSPSLPRRENFADNLTTFEEKNPHLETHSSVKVQLGLQSLSLLLLWFRNVCMYFYSVELNCYQLSFLTPFEEQVLISYSEAHIILISELPFFFVYMSGGS